MVYLKKALMVFIALVVLIGGTGITAMPAAAQGCTYYHTVQWGQTLAWIGRWYGVDYRAIAAANGIPYPSIIYVGQVLCIPCGNGYYGGYPPSNGGYPPNNGGYNNYNYRTWSFNIKDVKKDVSVTIRTSNFPDHVLFKAKMAQAGKNNWVDLPDLNTGNGGAFDAAFNIPAQFAGSQTLILRLIQSKKNGNTFTQNVEFVNQTGWSSGSGGLPPDNHGGYPYNGYNNGYYGNCNNGYWVNGFCGIPTIWIVSVVANSSVTFKTNNYPPNVKFDVTMGPMGTTGIGGIYVGSFNSGGGGSFTQTFPIPPELFGSYQISIRSQDCITGYYSFNWFYNTTAVDP